MFTGPHLMQGLNVSKVLMNYYDVVKDHNDAHMESTVTLSAKYRYLKGAQSAPFEI